MQTLHGTLHSVALPVWSFDDPLSKQYSIAPRWTRVTANGAKRAIASNNNGGLGAGSLYVPKSVALDSQNNLFIGDSANNRMLEFD